MSDDQAGPGNPTNRLDQETSPYLLQHADNPVLWQPWDEQAIELARKEQKPILLSIGYSSCHWCHVMAHESFEDQATAAVMNEHFVNIKVDREERPDLDKVYQTAHQLLTQQSGGWPLTMFLDPDSLVPFFGGTYFPKTPRHQLPGFVDLLMRIGDVFEQRREELTTQGEKVSKVLADLTPTRPEAATLDDQALLAAASSQLSDQYDQAEGGFGNAPKFPMPSTIERLLRQWAFQQHSSGQPSSRQGKGQSDRDSLDMVMTTLTKMARGGIFDHLGGGFCRYATDRRWMIPHFEKMLYDNGQLLSLYSNALAIGPDELFSQSVAQTANWMLREMRHPDGGFYAALDADSEGEEGKYYVWRKDQVKRLLTEEEYLITETLYGLDKPANFEGKWNLHRNDAWRSVVSRLSLKRPEADRLLAQAQHKLLSAREERVRPSRDEKILTAWNGLAIKGLANAGLRLGEVEWIEAARLAADFIRANLWQQGRLYANWQNGRRGYPAYLDDYANLMDGLLALLRAGWRDEDALFLRSLADTLLVQFEDRENGGFFFTAHDQEPLIHRPKPTLDEALPPGNGVAAPVLQETGHLLAESRYLEAADRTIVWARGSMEQYPAGHCTLLSALEAALAEPEQIIIRGPAQNSPKEPQEDPQKDLQKWVAAATTGYHPWRHVYPIAYEGVTELPPYIPQLVSADSQRKVSAYICQGTQCSLPLDDLDAFREALSR